MPATEMTAPVEAALQELDKLGIAYKDVEKPDSVESLQSVMERASREGLKVLPLGGGTSLGAANLPQRVDIVLDMTRMDKVIHFDPKNLNLNVQAGLNIQAVNQYLAEQDRGFFLPLDPLLSERATIGGTYASNSSGPWRQFYGSVRDLTLGAGALDAGGHEVKFGGVTVKNVSGYDLTKFFIGSAGSLCLITRVSFRILPLPDAFSACEVLLKDEEKAAQLLSDVRSSVLVPSALVAVREKKSPDVRIIAGFEGHPRAVERQNRELSKIGDGYGGSSQVEMGRKKLQAKIGQAFNPDLSAEKTAIFKVSVPISKGAQTLGSIRQKAKDQGMEAKLVLLAGNGVLYVHLDYADEAALSSFVEFVKDAARKQQGHAVPIQVPYSVLSSWGQRGDSVVDRHVLQPIKNTFDPAGILLPLNA
ncbi:MAG: FAD-binding oxidoreductase [Desulfohalobiaceae bacterium]|nr:FAD-binding oxidoreductase [Desulfohalobiaceae bacterium]